MAAAQGESNAESSLGDCYESGEGAAQDYAEAAKWYSDGCDARGCQGPDQPGLLL